MSNAAGFSAIICGMEGRCGMTDIIRTSAFFPRRNYLFVSIKQHTDNSCFS